MVAHNFASKFGINVRSPRPNLWPKKFYSIYLRRAHEEELKQALANENFDGQRTFNEAVLKAKKTEVPEITEHQKSGEC